MPHFQKWGIQLIWQVNVTILRLIRVLLLFGVSDSHFTRSHFFRGGYTQSLVDEFKLPAYRLIVNGGEFQDFPQLHFHLIADKDPLT